MAPSSQRHPKFGPSQQSISAIANSVEGRHKFKPSWQPPVFILLHRIAVQPVQPKGISLVGCPTSRQELPARYFQQCSLQAEQEGKETPSFQSISGGKCTAELQPNSLTSPNAKGLFLWGQVSPGSPHHHPAASHCVTGIQIVVFRLHPSKSCQPVALQLSSSQGLFSLFRSGLEKEKSRRMSFVQYISLLWEFVGSDTWREITLDNKAYDVFSLLFRTERSAWVRGCKRKQESECMRGLICNCHFVLFFF